MLTKPTLRHYAVLLAACCILISASSFAYQVSEITAVKKYGQVFITWKNPSAIHLQYNVYRSTTKFTTSAQLTPDKLLGFVRDSSAKNIRLSQEYKTNLFYKIDKKEAPLKGDRGLYVVTCTDNQSWYYAVTVTDLTNGSESKSPELNKNSLADPIKESVLKPKPVWQDSVYWSSGDVVQRYVQFVNNQEAPNYPAMNSTGSYGFNFYLIKRGKTNKYPLFVFYEGLQENSIQGNGLDEFANSNITDCYILGVDDWLPVPNSKGGIGVGENTYFCCYHENFNIYENNNPIPTNGTVKTYAQKRYIESIKWVKSQFKIDETSVYLVGVSAGGFGALLTASIIPEEIAAVYSVVEPVLVKPVGDIKNMLLPEQMWGASQTDLYSDVPDPVTGAPLNIYTLLNIKKMSHVNETLDLPLIFDVHGKNDPTIAWSSLITTWYDSVENNRIGGVFFWDGREHNGDDAGFTDSETTPNFYKYKTSKSYPAFSKCSIDDNPGNGSPNSGSSYGAINGYLEWDSVSDKNCSYSVHTFVKDMYIGGVLDPNQYTSCTTDMTLRRLQKFKPAIGATISWTNYDDNGDKLASGSFDYTGGLITLKGIKVKKGGNLVTFTINGCDKLGDENATADAGPDISFSRSSNGYIVHIESSESRPSTIALYDLMGRTVSHEDVMIQEGSNTFEVAAPETGIFLLRINSGAFSHVEKLFF